MILLATIFLLIEQAKVSFFLLLLLKSTIMANRFISYNNLVFLVSSNHEIKLYDQDTFCSKGSLLGLLIYNYQYFCPT